MVVTFAASVFPPLALGFFGLGTGYLIYGPQELAGWPKRDERGGSRQRRVGHLDARVLPVRLRHDLVYRADVAAGLHGRPPLYMAALAFTAYGIHWFALGWNRYRGNDPRTNAGMSVAFMVISALGANVFFEVGDWPVGLLFLGLFGIYFCDFFASITSRSASGRWASSTCSPAAG